MQQVHARMDALHQAFPTWAAQPLSYRAERLMALADALEADAEALIDLLQREAGKVQADAEAEVGLLRKKYPSPSNKRCGARQRKPCTN